MEEYYQSNVYKNQEEHFMRTDGRYPPILCVAYVVCPVLSVGQLYHTSIKKRTQLTEGSPDLSDEMDMPPFSTRLIISRDDPYYWDYKDICEIRSIWFLDY